MPDKMDRSDLVRPVDQLVSSPEPDSTLAPPSGSGDRAQIIDPHELKPDQLFQL